MTIFPFDKSVYAGEEMIKIGGRDAYKDTTSGYLGATEITTFVSSTQNKQEIHPPVFTNYSNTPLISDKTEAAEISQSFNQMLSTFRFLE